MLYCRDVPNVQLETVIIVVLLEFTYTVNWGVSNGLNRLRDPFVHGEIGSTVLVLGRRGHAFLVTCPAPGARIIYNPYMITCA